MPKTAIKPFSATWNPYVGCSHASPGCDHCWAEAFANRAAFNRDLPSEVKYAMVRVWDGTIEHFPDRDAEPATWRKPRLVFALSQTDIGHPRFPRKGLRMLLLAAATTPTSLFAALTKRPSRLYGAIGTIGEAIPTNLWLGTSIESAAYAWRLSTLLGCGDHAAGETHRRYWLSAEPLLGALDLYPPLVARLGLVVCGGESGTDARPCPVDAVRQLRDQCVATGTPFYFKSWGDWWESHQSDLPEFCKWPNIIDGCVFKQLPPEWAAVSRSCPIIHQPPTITHS